MRKIFFQILCVSQKVQTLTLCTSVISICLRLKAKLRQMYLFSHQLTQNITYLTLDDKIKFIVPQTLHGIILKFSTINRHHILV